MPMAWRAPRLSPLSGALALFLFILPLFVLPWGVDSYILPKEALIGIVAAGLAAGLVVRAAAGRPVRLLLEPVNGLLLLLPLWMAASLVWAKAPDLAWEETVRTSLLVLLAFALQAVVAEDDRTLPRVLAAVRWSTAAVAFLVLVQDVRAAFFPQGLAVRAVLGDWRDALSAVALGNTSHLGDLLALGFLFWLPEFLLARHRVRRGIAMGVLWLHAAALIVCWSVHSNASVLLASLLFAWLVRHHFPLQGVLRRRPGWTAGLLAGWVLVVLFYVVDHPLNPHGSAVWGAGDPAARGGIFGQAFASSRWTSGLDTRYAIWLTTLETIRPDAFLGSGAGSFTWTYPAAVSPIVLASPTLAQWASTWTNAAHNEVLQAWSELGIVGAALLVLLWGAALKRAWDRLDAGASPGTAVHLSATFAALTALALQSQMNFPLQLPTSSVLWVLLLAMPHLIPARGREGQALLVPVEREFGPVTLGVKMRNMAFPSEASLRATHPSPLGFCIGALAVLAALAVAAGSVRPVLADVAYRPFREARLRAAAGAMGPTVAEQRALAERVLALWPGHVDCRSALQELLLRSGDYEEVLRQTPFVLRKLNAVEVRLRRALALEALGRTTDADADWEEVFRRQPHLGGQFPKPFERYVQRHPELLQ